MRELREVPGSMMQGLLAMIQLEGEKLQVMVERLEREKEEVQGSIEEAVRERNRRAEELLQLPQARVELPLATEEASPPEARHTYVEREQCLAVKL